MEFRPHIWSYIRMHTSLCKTTLPKFFDESFFQPAIELYHSHTREKKETPSLPDSRFLKLGIMRCLEPLDSGRHFLQNLADNGNDLPRSTFFDALHDHRRLRVITQVSHNLTYKAAQIMADTDWLSEITVLHNRPVWAVDGHQIAHACHALTDHKNAHVPSGSLYAFNLRNGVLRNLCPHQGNGKRKHELRAFKEVVDFFKSPKATGRPIIAGDMNFIDTYYWPHQRLIDKDAPDFITREKENMKAITAIELPFNRQDPVNKGVLKYELVAYGSGLQMTRITYHDPEWEEENKTLVFICTDQTLAPGIVALIYRLRWKIEKTFHTFKSKLHERKEWATGPIAQEIHAHFMALTHNLLTLLLHKLDKEHGIKEEKIQKKHDEAEKKRKAKNLPHLIFYDIARKAVQLSQQFIRAVRNLIDRQRYWHEALIILRKRLQSYL